MREFVRELMARKLLTPEQLKEAIAVRKTILGTGIKIELDEVLLRKGFLTAQQLASVNAEFGKGRTDLIPGYEFLSKVGQGGMGAVYKARQLATGRLVAIKILLPSFGNEKHAVRRFLREAKAISKLSHPNIVEGFDAGYQRGTYYYAMEYVDGKTLAQILASGHRIKWNSALKITGQIASALAHAERHGILHRDVKPENIIIVSGGGAKLMDLGVAKLVGEGGSATITGTGSVMGTPAYMSPEQARGRADVDIRSDIYALGLTLFEMLTGRKAFDALTPMAAMAKRIHEDPDYSALTRLHVPEAVTLIVKRMTARKRDQRYPNAAELLGHVDVALLGKTIPKL